MDFIRVNLSNLPIDVKEAVVHAIAFIAKA